MEVSNCSLSTGKYNLKKYKKDIRSINHFWQEASPMVLIFLSFKNFPKKLWEVRFHGSLFTQSLLIKNRHFFKKLTLEKVLASARQMHMKRNIFTFVEKTSCSIRLQNFIRNLWKIRSKAFLVASWVFFVALCVVTFRE